MKTETPLLWCFHVETPEGTVMRDVYAFDRREAFQKVSQTTGQLNYMKIQLVRIVKRNDSIEMLP